MRWPVTSRRRASCVVRRLRADVAAPTVNTGLLELVLLKNREPGCAAAAAAAARARSRRRRRQRAGAIGVRDGV